METGGGAPFLEEEHCWPTLRRSPKCTANSKSPWLLGHSEQESSIGPHGSSANEESIYSQKCRFPWEGHAWQFKGESFVDKTADFGSIKAFRMDRLAEHTEQEAFGSSVTLVAALDAFSTPLLALPLLSRWCYTFLQPSSGRHTQALSLLVSHKVISVPQCLSSLLITCRNQSIPIPIT